MATWVLSGMTEMVCTGCVDDYVTMENFVLILKVYQERKRIKSWWIYTIRFQHNVKLK